MNTPLIILSISRCVCITNAPLKAEETITLIIIPPGQYGNIHSITVFQYSADLCVCPKDKCMFSLYACLTFKDLVYFFTQGSDAQKDLLGAVTALLQLPTSDPSGSDDGDKTRKPSILYHQFFNQVIRVPSVTPPTNLFVTSDPGVQLDFSEEIEQAKKLFATICPGELFLPKAPNPEDIIWEQDPENQEEAVKSEE